MCAFYICFIIQAKKMSYVVTCGRIYYYIYPGMRMPYAACCMLQACRPYVETREREPRRSLEAKANGSSCRPQPTAFGGGRNPSS
jgi:hypothetical protein